MTTEPPHITCLKPHAFKWIIPLDWFRITGQNECVHNIFTVWVVFRWFIWYHYSSYWFAIGKTTMQALHQTWQYVSWVISLGAITMCLSSVLFLLMIICYAAAKCSQAIIDFSECGQTSLLEPYVMRTAGGLPLSHLRFRWWGLINRALKSPKSEEIQ